MAEAQQAACVAHREDLAQAYLAQDHALELREVVSGRAPEPQRAAGNGGGGWPLGLKARGVSLLRVFLLACRAPAVAQEPKATRERRRTVACAVKEATQHAAAQLGQL